jgi:transposase
VRGELLSGVERRRRWSAREKAAVARASWEPGACVGDVARRFEVTRQQVYDWRAAARRGEFAGLEASAGFVEVIAAPADDAGAQPSAEVAGPPSDEWDGGDHGQGRAQPAPAGVGLGGGADAADPGGRRRMIAPGAGVRVYLACGVTDMRRGITGLAAHAQQVLKQNPSSGAVFCFRGRRGDRLKLLYWDGQGLCLSYKVLEKGLFPWPSPADGAAVRLTSAQLAMLWEGIDWRRPA